MLLFSEAEPRRVKAATDRRRKSPCKSRPRLRAPVHPRPRTNYSTPRCLFQCCRARPPQTSTSAPSCVSGRRGVLCHVCAYEYVHQRIGSARAKKRGRASQRQRPRQNNRNEEKVVKLVHARKDGRERVKVVRSIVWRVYTLRTDYGLVDPRVDPLHQTGLEKATLRTGTDGQMDKSIFNLRLAGWNIFCPWDGLRRSKARRRTTTKSAIGQPHCSHLRKMCRRLSREIFHLAGFPKGPNVVSVHTGSFATPWGLFRKTAAKPEQLTTGSHGIPTRHGSMYGKHSFSRGVKVTFSSAYHEVTRAYGRPP